MQVEIKIHFFCMFYTKHLYIQNSKMPERKNFKFHLSNVCIIINIATSFLYINVTDFYFPFPFPSV